MNYNILTIEHLHKTYRSGNGSLEVLKDIHISWNEGIIAILGANGAGKTTLIKSCTDLLNFDSGKILYGGNDLKRMSKREKSRAFSLLSEGNRNIYWKLTPLENLKYFASLRGITYAKIKDICSYLLNELYLYEKRNELVENLSRGMQQKVAIVCALAMDTPVVFLDEPTLGLDMESVIHLSQFLSKNEVLNKKLICITSHDFGFIENTTQAVYKLQNGILVDRNSFEQSEDSYLIKIASTDRNKLEKLGFEVTDILPEYCTIRISVPYYKLGEAIHDLNEKGFEVTFVESEKYNITNFYLQNQL